MVYIHAEKATGLQAETLKSFFTVKEAERIPDVMAGNHLNKEVGDIIRLKLMLLGVLFTNGKGTPVQTPHYPIRHPRGATPPQSPDFVVDKEPFLTLCDQYHLPKRWSKYSTVEKNKLDFILTLQNTLRPPSSQPKNPTFPPEYQTFATAPKAFEIVATLANSLKTSTNNWGPNEEIWDILLNYARMAKPLESIVEEPSPKVPPVIAFINLKGGVAKTTTAVGTAMFLAAKGKKVLVIDLDPQASASLMLVGEEKWKKLNTNCQTLKTLFEDVIRGEDEFDIESAIQTGVSDVSFGTGRIDLLASSVDIFEFQDRLLSAGEYTIAPVDYLRLAVEEKLPEYDYVLIDCPPNLGLFTKNGLRIASHYIIPTIPDSFSTYGIAQIVSLTKRFMEKIGREIQCLGVVATKVQENNDVHTATMTSLGAEKYAPFFKSYFKQGVDMTRASEYCRYKMSLTEKWKGNQGAHYYAFIHLVNEILQRLG